MMYIPRLAVLGARPYKVTPSNIDNNTNNNNIVIIIITVIIIMIHRIRPISVLRFWASEALTQAESSFQGVEFSRPQGIPQKFRATKSQQG